MKRKGTFAIISINAYFDEKETDGFECTVLCFVSTSITVMLSRSSSLTFFFIRL